MEIVGAPSWAWWPSDPNGERSSLVPKTITGPSDVEEGDIAVLVLASNGGPMSPLDGGWTKAGEARDSVSTYVTWADMAYAFGGIDLSEAAVMYTGTNRFSGSFYGGHVTVWWKPVTGTPTATFGWIPRFENIFNEPVSPKTALLTVVRGSSGVGIVTASERIRTGGGVFTAAIVRGDRLGAHGTYTLVAADSAPVGPQRVFGSGAKDAGDVGLPDLTQVRAFFDSGPDGEGWTGATVRLDPTYEIASWNTWESLIRRVSVEFLPRTDPYQPQPLAPLGEVGAGDVAFRWRHRPVSSAGLAVRSKLKLTRDGTTSWWDGTAWTATETAFAHDPAATVQVTAPVPVGAGVWSAWTQEQIDGRWSTESVVTAYSAVVPPVATITSVGDGGYEPRITWTSSQEQTAYQVTVLDPDDLILWDSGRVQSPAQERTLPVLDWTRDATHAVLVTVWRNQVASVPTRQDLPVTWTIPDPPTVDATADADGVRVTVAGPSGHVVEVQRWDGQGWLPVWFGPLEAPLVDHLAPWATDVAYRARIATNRLIGSAWSYSPPARSGSRCDWLVSAADPTRARRLHMVSEAPHEWPRETSVRRGTGAMVPMVTHGTTGTRSGQMVLRCHDYHDVRDLVSLLSGPCYLRLPSDETTPGEVVLIDRVGGHQSARLAQTPLATRHVTVDWVELRPIQYVDDAPPTGWEG